MSGSPAQASADILIVGGDPFLDGCLARPPTAVMHDGLWNIAASSRAEPPGCEPVSY